MNSTQHLPKGPGVVGWAGTRGQQISAGGKVELLREYAVKYSLATLVETGIYNGYGSGMPLFRSGLVSRYIVIDWQHANVVAVKAEFPSAEVFEGDSAVLLPAVVAELESPALFWLDAHGIPSDVDFPPCPLWAELAALARSLVAHVVVVDDLHMMGEHDWPTLPALRAWLEGAGRWDAVERDDVLRLTPR